MKNQLQNLESTNQSLRDKISDLEKKLATATTEIATLKLTIEKNNEQHLAERTNLQKQLEDAKQEMTVHLTTIADLKDETNAMTNKISKMSDIIDLKNGQLTMRDTEIAGLKENEQKLLGIKSKLEMELNTQVNENTALSAKNDDLQNQLKISAQTIEKKEKALADLHEEYTNTTDAMTRKISKMSDTIDSKNGEIKDRDNQILLLQESEKKLNDIKAKQKKKIIELELKLKNMKTDNDNLQSTVADLEEQLRKLQEKIAALEANGSQNQSQITELLAEIQSIKLELANANTTISTRDELIASLNIEIAERNTKLESLNETISQLTVKIISREFSTVRERAVMAGRSMKTKFQGKIVGFDDVLGSVEDLQDEVKKLEAQIDTLETSLKEKQALLMKFENAEAIRNAKVCVPKGCQTEEGGIRTSPGTLGFDHDEHDFHWEDTKIVITAKVSLYLKGEFLIIFYSV